MYVLIDQVETQLGSGIIIMTRHSTIDLSKFFFSICVVCIHTRLFSGVSRALDFWFVDMFCRMAVPFFVVCTGYYLSRKLVFDSNRDRLIRSKNNIQIFLTTFLRFSLLYITWSIVYSIIRAYTCYLDGSLSFNAFHIWLSDFIRGASYYHLWYPYCVAIGLLLLYLIIRILPCKLLPLVSVVLWLIGIFFYVYWILFFEDNSVSKHKLLSLMINLVQDNGIGCSVIQVCPLLLLGTIISRIGKRLPYYFYLFGSIFFYLLLGFEIWFLMRNGAENFSFIFFTFPLIYCVFILVLERRVILPFNSKLLADSSKVIYFIHPAFIFGVKLFGISGPLRLFIVVTLLSVMSGMLYAWLKLINRQARYNSE